MTSFEENGEITALSDDESSGIWRAKDYHDVPTEDIVSFAFGLSARYDPDKPIYVDAADPSKFFTAREARVVIAQISSYLEKTGFVRGDCVCLHSPNSIYYPLIWLGIIAAGGIFSGCNPSYTTSELRHYFKTIGCKIVIVHVEGESLNIVNEVASEFDGIRVVSSLALSPIARAKLAACGQDESSSGSDTEIHDEGASIKKNDQLLSVDSLTQTFTSKLDQERAIAVYATTSGTTGLPKAAKLSHQYIVAQAYILERQSSNRATPMSQLVCLPVFHAFAAQIALVLPLRLGITTYFMPRFRLDDFAKYIERYSITDTAIVPPIITALLSLAPPQQPMLRSLRYIVCAGAPAAAEVQSRLYDLLSDDAVVGQCWGATEVGWITLCDHEARDESGSVGRLLPNTSMKIVDDNGNLVTREGRHREAFIRSDSVFNGYLNNAAANAGVLDNDGFYRTGDWVYVRDGKIFIDGRIKDIIKVKGWQVSPEELEEVILQLPLVQDVAVAGHVEKSADGLDETKPRAYVVKCSPSLTSADVKEHVSQKLVSYKKLTGGVVFVDQIPRNPTGKVLRRELAGLRAVEEEDEEEGVALGAYCTMFVLVLCGLLWPVVLAFVQASAEGIMGTSSSTRA